MPRPAAATPLDATIVKVRKGEAQPHAAPEPRKLAGSRTASASRSASRSLSMSSSGCWRLNGAPASRP